MPNVAGSGFVKPSTMAQFVRGANEEGFRRNLVIVQKNPSMIPAYYGWRNDMIKVKNVFDRVETDDGARLWVEPCGLTTDLREWCEVDHILCHLGPLPKLAEWLDDHPEGYEEFRAAYHDGLAKSSFLPLLQQLACAASRENFTLLHLSEDPCRNIGVALHEFISELQAYCPPDMA